MSCEMSAISFSKTVMPGSQLHGIDQMRNGALLIACGFAYISPYAYRFEKETRIWIHLWSGKSRYPSNIFRAMTLTRLLNTLPPEAVCFIAKITGLDVSEGEEKPSSGCALFCCAICFSRIIKRKAAITSPSNEGNHDRSSRNRALHLTRI
ncbi:uncharacterized protein BO95DRAFT_248292 [Aspergillus brunneoviolaceus CBS 621.78]|uniref:Uncharacterized protein n=1 Tax=Aspergillus brunneoviolaceus CBS 621.78 TaxID=1450534 RepID=A0ACD1GLC6_9EURO|nr:hypothetical protein BO95DRAFT_248292 [Aspergillus brunneoviolaceus CBS 621.78]RAH49876.1 hypothetical protein BO95DRAFT_248292 [Aspergillus brunneoviolaceus CBS 621.78]